MNTFSHLVSAHPSLPKELMKALKINQTNISNVKSGRRNMPERWMPHVVKLVKRLGGKVTIEQLVADNLARKSKITTGFTV